MQTAAERNAWLLSRRHGLGSSDAPAILGCSPFSSALEVYADKAGLSVERERDDEAMEWGQTLEPIIAREFARRTGRRVEHNRELRQHRERPHLVATVDAYQWSPDRTSMGVLEIKTSSYGAGRWDEGIPEHVWIQLQHQLYVTEADWGTVCALFAGTRLRWLDVERDDAFIDGVLVPELEDFWARVKSGTPPAPDGTESARRALAALFPHEKPGAEIALPGELVDLDAHYAELIGQRKALAREIEECEQRVKAALGEAETGRLANGTRYTWKTQERKEYTVKAARYRVLRRHTPKTMEDDQ